jgi:hypothetical protein
LAIFITLTLLIIFIEHYWYYCRHWYFIDIHYAIDTLLRPLIDAFSLLIRHWDITLFEGHYILISWLLSHWLSIAFGWLNISWPRFSPAIFSPFLSFSITLLFFLLHCRHQLISW